MSKCCGNICGLCPRLIISDSVTFTGGNLLIDLPAGSYARNGKYCIVVAQAIPTTTTVDAPVFITIGGDATVLYPLDQCDCTQVTACGIKTRTRYTVCVETTATGGTFRVLGRLCNGRNNELRALPAPAAAAAPAGDGA